MKRHWWAAVACVVLMAACGGGDDDATGSGGEGHGGDGHGPCPAPTTELKIEAKSLAYDKDCLAVPADTAFTIALDNKEPSVPHNVAILKDADTTEEIFTGELVTGPGTATYDVPALAAGTYHFHCSVHPEQMEGTFEVK